MYIARLRADGHEVVLEPTVEGAIALVQNDPKHYDMILTRYSALLNGVRTTGAGLSFIQAARQAGVSAPIYCLTSRGRSVENAVVNAGGTGVALNFLVIVAGLRDFEVSHP